MIKKICFILNVALFSIGLFSCASESSSGKVKGTEYYSIQVSGLHGFINAKGDVMVEPKFDTASTVTSNGYAWVKEGSNEYFFNILSREKVEIPKGITIIPIAFNGFYLYLKDGREGIICSREGDFILKENEYFSLNAWLRGIVAGGVWFLEFDNERKFFTIKKGEKEFVQSPDDYSIFKASRRNIITTDGEGAYYLYERMKDKWEFLFETTREIYLPKDNRVLYYSSVEDEYGFLNMEGREAFSSRFYYAYSFAFESALVVDKKNREFFIDTNGEKILSLDDDFLYLQPTMNFLKNFTIVRKGDYYGVVRRNGEVLVEPYQDFIWRDITKEAVELFSVRNEKQTAWFNNEGEIVWKSDGFVLRK
ncbi:MAG: WG repeat-containing protein [Opitutales bacterium]|nr:WG repeat-containing protein [Opitutales bacterium]